GVADTPEAYFLDSGQSGLIGTIATLSAEVASAAPTPEQGTIASHCGHVLFLLRLFDAYEQGQTPTPDWEGSWSIRSVDAAAWRALRDGVRAAYSAGVAGLPAHDRRPQPTIPDPIKHVGRGAYHV